MPWSQLGDEIRRVRRKRNLSQIQLAKGICHQSEISRIEAGKSYPSIDILSGISKKLQIPLKYWFEVIFYEDIKNQKKLKLELESLTRKRDFQRVYELTEEELKTPMYHEEFRQYLLWNQYVATFELGKLTYKQFCRNLNNLLEFSQSGSEIYQDVYILNSLAIASVKHNDYEKAIEYFQRILSQDYIEENLEIFIKVTYNYSKLLYLRKDFEEAFRLSSNAINVLLQQSSMYLLGHLYYQRAECKEYLNMPVAGILEDIESAYYIFKLQDLPKYMAIVEDKKEKYSELHSPKM
ncbi:MAG: helix-turn-helix domain-containing protein [Bacillus sp. (in: firmicutes)]